MAQELDPDQLLKRIFKFIGTAALIQKYATKRRRSPTKINKAEMEQNASAASKVERSKRISSITQQEKFVMDVVGHFYDVSGDVIQEGIADDNKYIQMLHNLFEPNGAYAIMFFYKLFPAPSIKSGRLDLTNRYTPIVRAICTDGRDVELSGLCVVVYRTNNTKVITIKSTGEDLNFISMNVADEESPLSGFVHVLGHVVNRSITVYKEFGLCKMLPKIAFIHGFDSFLKFLKATTFDVNNRIEFEVVHKLYKGFLLAPWQVRETARMREKVYEVEKIFSRWIRLVKTALVQGNQIRRDPLDVGPLHELEYWRSLLTRYTSIVDFVQTKIFIHHFQCLIYSRSKLVSKWKKIDVELTAAYCETKDNLRYITFLEKFWDALYKCDPPDIQRHLPSLMTIIRNVYNTSLFYNTSQSITSILSKVSNQLVIACRDYLTRKDAFTIWSQALERIITKVKLCREMFQVYNDLYYKIIADQRNNPKEIPWNCSPILIFGNMNGFNRRIDKISQILQIEISYRVLDVIKISGLELYTAEIKKSIEKITSKTSDPLAHRNTQFDIDHSTFLNEIETVELQMQTFLKNYIKDIPSSHSILLVLRRFEKLNLDCFCIDRRYLDVAMKLEKEIQLVKDIYNENRSDPPITRCSPPIAGRIMWVRNLFHQIDEPMQVLKAKKNVIEHRHSQLCVKYYNYITPVFLHFEMMQHKAWYDYSEQVSNKLRLPIMIKDIETATYKPNLHQSIHLMVRETEAMWKLGLPVSAFSQMLTCCKDKVFDAYEKLLTLIKLNNSIRISIDNVLVNLMKPILQKLSISFKPALSTITWTSQNIDDFFDDMERALNNLEVFLKKCQDILKRQIEDGFMEIAHFDLINLPDSAVDPQELLEINYDKRRTAGENINMKSQAIEKSVVDLINNFANVIEVPDYDNQGRYVYQLQLDQQNESNWRVEELKPIDKFDWINFEKIVRLIAFPPLETNRERHCFRDYENMSYGLHHLHNDCMDLFTYFNHVLTSTLCECTKDSLEKLRIRVNLSNVHFTKHNEFQPPLYRTNMEIDIGVGCRLKPNLDTIQRSFQALIQNVVETSYSVLTWGKQAKTSERMKRKPVKEMMMDKNMFRTVADHKETTRALLGFFGGLTLLEPDIHILLNEFYNRHSYLWHETREEKIIEFVQSNPLIVDIRDKLIEYDTITEKLGNLDKTIEVGPILILTDKTIDVLVAESRIWKQTLGVHLSARSKKRLVEICDFIIDQEKILNRTIRDLDDVRLAMNCLQEIRENFIEIDRDLVLMVEIYQLFLKFEIYVPREDYDRVDSLVYNFRRMYNKSKDLTRIVAEMEQPLLTELSEGVKAFKDEVEAFDEEFITKGPMIEGLPAKEASDRTFLYNTMFDDLMRKYEIYASGERLFGLPVTEYPVLALRKKEFNLLTKLYSLYTVVLRTVDGYYEKPWTEIDIEAITEEIQDFQIRCKKLPKAIREWPAFIDLKKKIDDFNETCPLLEVMTNSAVKDRHWDKLQQILGVKLEVNTSHCTLGMVMAAPLLKFKDDVEDICIGAVKERDIESKLRQTIADWKAVNLQFAHFKLRGEMLIKVTETLEIISATEDSLMIMNSLASNRYNTPFKKEIMLWLHKLSKISEILEQWITVQNLWVYLEAVFGGGDIARQLPQETKKFSNIDKAYVRIMYRARENPNVVECCTADETMSNMLPYLIEQLEGCQKSLTGYLETKRLIFPRFFFVSDPVLLEILGQASDPTTIQPHLLSIFDAIATVDFEENSNDKIIAMNSDNGERIMMEVPVRCLGGVEIWLGKLLIAMKDTVKGVCAELALNFNDPDFDFLTEFQHHCGQSGLIGCQILWTRDAEFALRKYKTNKALMKITNDRFLDLLNGFIELTIKDLTKLQRIRYETIVTIHVHQRDIFDDLVKNRIRVASDFEWQKQPRFYFDEDTDEIIVKITDVDFEYQDEYLGVTERLAITPLTDRCYITLAQCIGMSMGGAPAGPAGTGKTETTKDMGRALGKLVVVFNCSDQMDFRGLGRIYKGLAQSGSWGCFDEFNRIDLPVLSVAAQQISIVLTARKQKQSFFIFSDGDNVSLNPEFGIFITMNPGYAGRQELPENLKIQFRTVSMMVPDRQIIMRVKLASCGFKDNIVLARKFFTLYKLCEEQLSKQVHYDFGLRNILSVLRTLGAQKRANPTDTEETIVMRVLRDMNVSKLIDEDEPLFLSLIEDLFPGLKLKTSTYKDLQKAIQHSCNEMGLINHPEWNLKIVQLYETSLVRHGLMTMGPTGAGKTKCINTLLKSFTDMGHPHRELRMNPKAITAPQMFGRLDVSTNDWTDGIFSTLWRRTRAVKPSDFVWLVLDGPVDAVWIENLNSVLDDNKTLTLANGDRIVMAQNCKLVFEPDNVDNASPATVSRVGMVFMSSSALKWTPIMMAWMKKRQPDEAAKLTDFFNKIYDDAHIFVQSKLDVKMRILEALYIRQCLDMLEGMIPTEKPPSTRMLERIFLFCLMWSLGCVLEHEDRLKMEDFLLKHPSKMRWPKLISPEESIFEYVVNTHNSDWEHWSTRIEEYVYPTTSVPEYSSILVPNVDNVRTAFLIENISKQNKAVLLIGEQGTAKTVMIKGYMSTYDPEVRLSKSLNFSSATTPNMFQRIIEGYIEKRVGLTFGPPNQRSMTVFIDDINMPIINEWGDQITNEIVRQLMEMGGFYSLERPGDFMSVIDVQLIAAMIHPGGGRNDIPHRLKRQFSVFNCTLPSSTSMDKIFRVIGEGYFCIERFSPGVVEFVPNLIPLTRILWQQTKNKMLPTPAKFHYIFNLRDLSRIWQGILTIQRAECGSVTEVLKLWRHECIRVISDRFTNVEDKTWFLDRIDKIAELELGDYYDYYNNDETYFVDFLREPLDPTGEEGEEISLDAPKIYEEYPSEDYVKEKVITFMAQLNDQIRGANLDLVFFHDALVHLMIISRIVRTPRGNGLLVGVGGSGKRSLTKLASFIANYKFHMITLTRAYNVSNLMDDLKFLYVTAGFHGHGISFIFTDNDIKDESFLEFLNNVLSSGEVANLFAKDEMDEMLNELIPVMKKESPKRIPTLDNLYDYFISRARNNLHVVLCFSPIGEKFRTRALKFPGLISGCTVDWFQPWPQDARIAVSRHVLIPFEIVCSDTVKDSVIQMISYIHNDVSENCDVYYDKFRRQIFVTPKSLLSFLDTYKLVYVDIKSKIQEMAKRMSTGLNKLIEAAESVKVLKVELEETNKKIVVATQEADVVLKEVSEVAAAAEVVKLSVAEVKGKAESLVEQISIFKAQAEEKLENAKPALEEAEAALRTVKGADIATVRKLGKPPHLITVIMDAVLILFKRKLEPVKPDIEKRFLVTSWAESLKMMSDIRFLPKIIDFPKDFINAEMIDLLQAYFDYPQFTYDAAKLASGSVAGLLLWTHAMAKYYAVNKDVLPLKANLAKQEQKFSKASVQLQAASDLLEAKEQELAEAEATLKTADDKKQVVLNEAKKCQDKMDAAAALINGLAGERVRWTEQLAQFKSETDRLVGDVLFLTAFLSYVGPFNQEFRLQFKKIWQREIIDRRIPMSVNINFIDSLTDSAQIGEWNLQGLPTDELSTQNGIIVTKCQRFPLLIDPQTQGKAWIKAKEKDNNFIVTQLTHRYFRNHIEDSVAAGSSVLIEDVGEELDPALDNLLEKNLIKSGTTFKVKIGDKEVDWNDEFRLYITTKLPNPLYTPEISARTSIIDFTVTMQGLEDQLLGRVILMEKKELEEERTNLLKDITTNRRKMKDLESNLLHKLSTTQGSLLDDVSVIIVLNNSKTTSTEVSEKLVIARDTEIKINHAREEFRPVATRGSVLYFLVSSMAMVNNMYQTSLAQFLERFDSSLLNSEKSHVVSRRLVFIIEYLTFEIFRYISRGLFESHKYLFALLMTLNIDLQKNNITYEEFQNFIKGGAALNINECEPKPFKWITDVMWLNLVQLSTMRTFSHILTQISHNERQWKVWFEKDRPEEETIPDGYNSLDVFRKLLLIRSICADRTISQSRKYIAKSLGERFAVPVILNYDDMLEESHCLTPLVCFLSMGSDPTVNVEMLAKKNEVKVRAISMGQGQEVHSRVLISQSLEEGNWVLLQNCHLGLEYMLELVTLIQTLESSEKPIIETFRIWITTEEHLKFPITLLQLSIKYTNEPPAGVRAGLKRTYGNMSQDMLDYSESPFYLPLIYAVSFLHTIVQERRKFGPLGWNIPYEFNSADWLASCMFMQNHLDEMDLKTGISWSTVRYMIGEVQYGGRVTDDYDKILLNTFARAYFSDRMFTDEFEFFVGYKIYRFKTINEYLDIIEQMNSIDPPQVYGLHSNADITYQSNTTQSMLDTILSIQPRQSSIGGGETREAVVARLTHEMLEKVPREYDPFEVMERLRGMGQFSPMNIFLRQEIDRMQAIIFLVRTTLNDLLLAIEGTIIMNEQLRDALDSIFDARIPVFWKKRSWLSSSLGFWFSEFIDRNQQLSTWIFTGRPITFWMPGFFNPQGFITAMKQEVTRSHKGWALDQVSLTNEVLKVLADDCKKPPKDGVFVYGLFIDGAGWDRRNCRLVESTNKILYTMMPVVWIYAINSTAPKASDLYTCPVYKKKNRTDLNYITPLVLKSLKPPDHWILRGVALLCDIK